MKSILTNGLIWVRQLNSIYDTFNKYVQLSMYFKHN